MWTLTFQQLLYCFVFFFFNKVFNIVGISFFGSWRLNCYNVTILKSTNICQTQREATYTNHTRVSQLVPVLEVMLGVTGHRFPFKVGGQAQLFKKNKAWASNHWTEQKLPMILVLPSGMLFFTTLSTRLFDPPTSGCKKVPWPILSGGRLSSRSVSSSWEGTCSRFCRHVNTLKSIFAMEKKHENVEFVLLRGAVTASVQSSWLAVAQEVGPCHGQP